MSGAGTKRKKTHIPSDFKRRKAKVGKRAPQQLNLTDTSFKTVAVQVQGQSIDTSKGGVGDALLSSRGKSIPELTHQLHHPAGTVRVSAIRGLANVIQLTPFDMLQSHLSTLLPVIAKCACVDDEDDVRTLGLGALRDLISSDRSDKLWKPFVPLLAAFVISALNSLDRSTRLDGSRAVDIISRLPLDRKTVVAILPAYTTLLTDHRKNNNKSTAEGGKKKNAYDNSVLTVLQSLVALLRCIDDSDDHLSDLIAMEPDLTLRAGGSSALLILASRDSHLVENIDGLDSLTKRSLGWEANEARRDQSDGIANSIVFDLFAKLRDVYVEAMQRGIQGASGSTVGVHDMEEVSLLVTSFHLLWKGFARNVENPVITHSVNMMLESMPIKSRTQEQLARYEVLNGNLCLCVIEMGTGVINDEKWTEGILEYLLPKLDARNTNQSEIAINVLSSLIYLKDSKGMLSIQQDTQDFVLKRIMEVYFSVGVLDLQVLRSLEGRKAVALAIRKLKENKYEILSETLNKMTKYFPNYLMAWKGDYMHDSNDILETLLCIVRRIHLSDDVSSLLSSLRQGMGHLMKAEKQQVAVFEQYSLQMQRKTICLIVSLESPTQDVLDGLGKVCAKAGTGISHDLADFILDVMHSARTTIKIQAYLGFIMSSIGVPKSAAMEKGILWVSSRDKAVLRASRALRRCGTSKVLPMIAPMLLSWLKPACEESFVRFRWCYCFCQHLPKKLQSLIRLLCCSFL
ncbi:MAG UNVERIFIED_CONTAM: hypothetical protein LVR29_18035 [Microcystis novacekii LVE1205-3]|jgi:pre-rRNA-processing protein IPI1